MFSRRKKVPEWECPQGYRVGQPLFYEGWLEDRAFGLPVVKVGVHNPMLPDSGRKKLDVAGAFGGGIAIALLVACIMVFIGQLFDDDPWAAFRDVSELAHRVF